MIHKLDDGTCVISACSIWLPGCYENERAAKFAFKVSDQDKAQLRDSAVDGVITWNQIHEFRKEKRNENT